MKDNIKKLVVIFMIANILPVFANNEYQEYSIIGLHAIMFLSLSVNTINLSIN